MRENRTSGTVRGVPGNRHSYRGNAFMRNTYRIVDYSEDGIPYIEVYGDQFHYQDLYEIVGRKQYMSTFQLKSGSESFEEFGATVLGVIHYDDKILKALESSMIDGAEVSKTRIRIDSPDRELSLQQKGDLKYRGIIVSDIEKFSFLVYKEEVEKHETGEKKVPGILEIEVDFSDMDVDILNQNYLSSKINSGTNLIQYEKEQFIGITLAINDGRIDSRILKYLGYDEHDLKDNLNIWKQFYEVKKRRNQLTDIDDKDYREIKGILSLEKIPKVLKELANSGLSDSEDESEKVILREIIESIKTFSPSILLHGKNQVYWDVDSYIHIALRHVKDYQLGLYKNKTPFPYKAVDLKTIIKNVLHRVEDEIKQHLSQDSGNDFTRHGAMAVFYNEDHYHLRINSKGRLTQFHAVG